MANSVDPDQTASIGVCSGSTLFASILKFVSNVRQLFAADDFSRQHFQMHFFLGALRVKVYCVIFFLNFEHFHSTLNIHIASTKQGLICLAQGHNAVTPVRLHPQPLGLKSSTLPLSHCRYMVFEIMEHLPYLKLGLFVL